MTGFGRGSCTVAGRRYVVEVRSVNHRFLEVKQRLPWSDPTLEHRVVQKLRGRVDRGALSVSVRDEGGGPTEEPVRLDAALARRWYEALEALRAQLGVSEPIPWSTILQQPGVVGGAGEGRDSEAVWSGFEPGLDQAIANLLEARDREGQALHVELTRLVDALDAHRKALATLTGEAPTEARRRLKERLERLLGDVEAARLDPTRLETEVALLAERADVTEELTRLGAHLEELRRQLAASGAIGRRLDFLSQELHREVNTIGSKSQSAPVARAVIDAKADVERLREQVQNVE